MHIMPARKIIIMIMRGWHIDCLMNNFTRHSHLVREESECEKKIVVALLLQLPKR